MSLGRVLLISGLVAGLLAGTQSVASADTSGPATPGVTVKVITPGKLPPPSKAAVQPTSPPPESASPEKPSLINVGKTAPSYPNQCGFYGGNYDPTRFLTCEYTGVTLTHTLTRNGVTTVNGQITVYMIAWTWTYVGSQTSDYEVRGYAHDGWGYYADNGVYISDYSSCTGTSGCSMGSTKDNGYSVRVRIGDWVSASYDKYKPAITTTTWVRARTTTRFEFLGLDSTLLDWDFPPSSYIRCDTGVTLARGVGCIVPGYWPTFTMELYGPLLIAVAFYENAQTSLPTQPGFLTPLHREANDVTIAAHRAKACSGFKPFPLGSWGKDATGAYIKDSCDEFPFASTKEADGQVLTSHVPLNQNTTAGSYLFSKFIQPLRVLDDDPYYFTVTQ